MSIWAHADGFIRFTVNYWENKGNYQTRTVWTSEHIKHIVDEVIRSERNKLIFDEDNPQVEDYLWCLPVDGHDSNITWSVGDFYNRRNYTKGVQVAEDRRMDNVYYSVDNFRLYFNITRRGSTFEGVSRTLKRIISRLKKCGMKPSYYHLIMTGLPYGTLIVDSEMGILDVNDKLRRFPARVRNCCECEEE